MVVCAARTSKECMGLLDTGVNDNVISEHVVRNRWPFELVDTSSPHYFKFPKEEKVKTLGQLTMSVWLDIPKYWQEVTFLVIPNSYVKYRFNTLLSDDLARLMWCK